MANSELHNSQPRVRSWIVKPESNLIHRHPQRQQAHATPPNGPYIYQTSCLFPMQEGNKGAVGTDSRLRTQAHADAEELAWPAWERCLREVMSRSLVWCRHWAGSHGMVCHIRRRQIPDQIFRNSQVSDNVQCTTSQFG